MKPSEQQPHFEFKFTAEEEEQLLKQERLVNRQFSTTQVPPIELPPCLRNTMLRIDQFDIRGDKDFSKVSSSPSEINVRGGFEYFKPKHGKAYGLYIGEKVKLFGEWAVGFHGVRQDSSFVGIMREGLKPGPGQSFAAQKDFCGEVTVGRGIYFSPDINVCLGYSNAQNPLILQCLLNPAAIRTTTQKDYWVVTETKDIVPYRIVSYTNPIPQR